MDEVGETKITGYNFWLDLPETYPDPGKYPFLRNIKINELIRINYIGSVLLPGLKQARKNRFKQYLTVT